MVSGGEKRKGFRPRKETFRSRVPLSPKVSRSRKWFRRVSKKRKMLFVQRLMEDYSSKTRDPIGFLLKNGFNSVFFREWGLSSRDLCYGVGLSRVQLKRLGFSNGEIDSIDLERDY